jgi:hypothetical protein
MTKIDELVNYLGNHIGKTTSSTCGLIAQLTYHGAIDHIAARKLLQITPSVTPELAATLSRLVTAKAMMFQKNRRRRR